MRLKQRWMLYRLMLNRTEDFVLPFLTTFLVIAPCPLRVWKFISEDFFLQEVWLFLIASSAFVGIFLHLWYLSYLWRHDYRYKRLWDSLSRPLEVLLTSDDEFERGFAKKAS